MPGFGPSVLPEKRPAPPATEIRALRSPVEIARLTADAFYGACVNPAVPYQLGLAAVKKGLVVADLRRLGAAGATRAPDGRAVVSASAVLQAAHRPRADASLWASPSGGSRARAPGGAADGPRNRGARNRGARNRRLDRRRLARRVSTIGPPTRRARRASPSRTPPHRTLRARAARRPSAGDVVARCVEAHPKQPIMLAGTASGTAVLWRFAPDAAENGRAGVVAAPGSRGGAIGANASTKSRNVETIAGSSNESSSDASSAISAVAWSPGGGRFAIGTAGGVVSTWRADGALGPRATPAATRAPTEGDARVEALEFLSPSVVAAAGSKLAGAGDSLALWDTLAPPTSPPAGALAAHEGGATAMCVLPGTTLGGSPWPMLATAGRSGISPRSIFACSAATAPPRWCGARGRDAHGHAAAVKSLAVMRPPAERRRVDGVGSVLVSGCKDGDVRAWSARAGRHLQHVRAAHERHTFIAPRGGGRNVLQVGVSKIVALEGGALTCGGDGTVKLFRLAPDAFRLAA